MSIGEKIRDIRAAKCMTQSQLAGEFITRNMLSRIENGAAKPSLPTVIYIAKKLNVPAGYLLAEGDEEFIYRKIYNIDNIKRAFKDGDYRICRDICRSIGYDDDELNLILSRCCIGIAKEEFFFGRLRTSVRYFDEALEYDGKTIYCTDVTRAEAAVYLRYMRKISQTLASDVTDEKKYDELASNDVFCDYVLALEELDCNNTKSIDEIIASHKISVNEPLTTHIRARAAMKKKDYNGARKYLKKILNLQERIADPVLYSVFFDLEICSKDAEDYKSAYEYSADKVNLLERMLSEADE